MTDTRHTPDDGNPFLRQFRGSFVNMLRWPQLDELWARLRSDDDQPWYAYAVGETPPEQPLDTTRLHRFIDEMDALLHQEHDEDYCGIVYVDQPSAPTFIKIYDPNNLGAVCGSSAQPPLPGWILSHTPPCDLQQAIPPTNSRRRWWQRLTGRAS